MSSERGEVVRVEGVVKDFRPGFGLRRKRVLDGISFSVREGEVFGFVGPNGAGKTTTLKILMGLIRASEGRARVLGHDVGETEFRRHVGFLPESPYFYEYLTGREFLNFYARVCGLSARQRTERIAEVLDTVGMSHAADMRLRTYSKGMLQRIGIAQAIVHDPQVVFLDEPMSGLDPIGRKEIRDLILHLRGQGKTVFMNTHILSDVEMTCDRVAIIVEGRINWEGRVEDFETPGQRQSELILAQLDPELATALEQDFGAGLRGLGDRIELLVPEKHLSEVLSAVLSRGAEVISVAPRRASLETIFLSAVRDGDR